MSRGAIAAACCAALLVPATGLAQASDDVVKLGILSDMSSVYSDGTGPGSTEAAVR
jgi:branched-chain amino acid transport system substrate-binding protein